MIEALLEVADRVIIGGGMCFTFLAAQGHPVGASLLEEDQIETCKRLLDSGAPITIPHDITALGPGGKIGDPDAGGEVRQMGTNLPDGWMGLDIGPGTAAEFLDIIAEARTDLLERPDGRVRGPPLRGRHPHGRRGHGRGPGLHRGRRRRQRRRAGRSSACRTTSTTSRPVAARRSSCSSTATCPASRPCEEHPMPECRASPQAAHQRQLEDEPQPLRGDRPRSTSCATCSTKDDLEDVEVSVHPPFTDIRTVQTFVESEKVEISLGAQNCHWEDKGAFTGEVSPAFLAKLNVRYVIVGHSERRELFGETDEWVNKKLHAVLKHAHDADPVRRRDARGARGRRHRRQGHRPGPGRARRA